MRSMPIAVCAAILLVNAPRAGQDPEEIGDYVRCLRAEAEAWAGQPEEDRDGAELFDRLVRAMLRRSALDERPEIGLRRGILALGYTLDVGAFLQKNLLLRGSFHGVETEEEQERGRMIAGKALLSGRNDLAQHFAVLAAMAELLGGEVASRLGLAKEIGDAKQKDRGAGTGFSFADICAGEAGMAFMLSMERHAQSFLETPSLTVEDFMPPIERLREELGYEEFVL